MIKLIILVTLYSTGKPDITVFDNMETCVAYRNYAQIAYKKLGKDAFSPCQEISVKARLND